METNKTQKRSPKRNAYLNDFAKMFLQIMAFNLATGSSKDGAPSIVNTIGILFLRLLFEHRPKKEVEEPILLSSAVRPSNLFQQLKSKIYGHRKPKV